MEACVLARATVFVTAGGAGPASAADVAFGAYLAGECVACHRNDGQDKGIPSIVGWPVEQFVAAMQSYESKDRANPVMVTIAGKFTDTEVEALAAYYATLMPR